MWETFGSRPIYDTFMAGANHPLCWIVMRGEEIAFSLLFPDGKARNQQAALEHHSPVLNPRCPGDHLLSGSGGSG